MFEIRSLLDFQIPAAHTRRFLLVLFLLVVHKLREMAGMHQFLGIRV